MAYDIEKVADINNFDGTNFDSNTVVAGTKHTAGIGGLKKGKIYIVFLVPTFSDEVTPPNNIISLADAETTPAKLTTSKFVVDPITSTSVKFDAVVPTYADGVQIKLYTYSGSVVSTKKYTSTFSVGKNKAYKYKARAYVKNETTGKTYYGPWSSYRYFDNPAITYTKVKGGAKIKVKGVSGVKKYKVYVSTSSSKKGSYTTTITPKSGKYLTKKITKIGKSTMKKGKKYYVKVYPIMKNDKTSDIYSKFSFKRS